MPKLFFLIISYHPPKSLLSLINTIKNFDYLIVDNSEKNIDYLHKFNYVKTPKNLGYAGGINFGINITGQQKYDWLIILNQDITLTNKTLASLFAQLNNCKDNIVGPYLGELDPKRYTTIFPATNNKIHNLSYISGEFICLNKRALNIINQWCEKYFMYYEDVDFCFNAKKQNLALNTILLPELSHSQNYSLGNHSFLHEYYLTRNHIYFLKKYAPLKIKAREFVRLPKTIWEFYINKNFGALHGLKDALLPRTSTTTSKTTT